MPKAEAISTAKNQTKSDQAVRTFVLDTSVLLSDPKAMFLSLIHISEPTRPY